jgi:hypothetical protein
MRLLESSSSLPTKPSPFRPFAAVLVGSAVSSSLESPFYLRVECDVSGILWHSKDHSRLHATKGRHLPFHRYRGQCPAKGVGQGPKEKKRRNGQYLVNWHTCSRSSRYLGSSKESGPKRKEKKASPERFEHSRAKPNRYAINSRRSR